MGEEHPSPFPTGLVLDTSFLRTIGGTESEPYRTFVDFVEQEGRELYLTPGVVDELLEQRGYMSIDWVDRADTTPWLSVVDALQPGVRVHDGPRARAKSWTASTSGWHDSSRPTRIRSGRRTPNSQEWP